MILDPAILMWREESTRRSATEPDGEGARPTSADVPLDVEIDGQRERYCTLPRYERLLYERQNGTDERRTP